MENQNETIQKTNAIGRYDNQGNRVHRAIATTSPVKVIRKKYRTRRVRKVEKKNKFLRNLIIAAILIAIGYSFQEKEINIINGGVVKQSAEAATHVIPERLVEPKTLPAEQVVYEPTVEEVKTEIRLQSRQFGLNEDAMLALAFCESEYKWNAKNPVSTARGVYQYTIGTWEETRSSKQGLERNNIKANIREAMLDILNGESWRWVDCRAKLKSKGIYL